MLPLVFCPVIVFAEFICYNGRETVDRKKVSGKGGWENDSDNFED